MSLLFMDGFDHYSNSTRQGKWDNAMGGVNGPGRTGTGFGQFNGSPTERIISVPGDFFILGCAMQWQASSLPIGNNIVWFREGATDHIVFAMVAGGFLTVSRGGTLIATATSSPFTINNWYYMEFKVVIHDTTGSIEVRVDGTPITWSASIINIDTRNGGATGNVDRFAIGGNFQPPYTMVDDLYLVDDAGAAPRNTFLGAVKIETLYPQTDAVAAGSNAGLTPSTGTDHGALVDETPPNTTDWNGSPTVGLKDTYNYPSLTLTGTVLAIQSNLYVNKSDAAARQVCPVIRAGGVDFDGSNIAPLTTFQYFPQIHPVNPNGGAEWTTADIITLQAGMKVTV